MQPRHTRHRQVITILLATCLSLTSCSLFKADALRGDVVGEQGAELTVDGVGITVPAGAAPVGTKVKAAFEGQDPIESQDAHMEALAKPFKITLGDGVQPEKPLTVSIPVDQSLIGEDAEGLLFAMMIQSEGTDDPDIVEATWDMETGAVTAQVPHLSLVWPVSFDLNSMMQEVRDTVMQGLGIEYPEPSCTGDEPVIANYTYTTTSPAQAWLCLSEDDGALSVTVTPNSPLAFLTSADEDTVARSTADVSISAVSSLLANHGLGFNAESKAMVMPGVETKFLFDGPPDEVTLNFEQFPAAMLVAVLAQVLEVAVGGLDSATVAMIETGGCVQSAIGVVEVGESLSAESVAAVIRTFFGCAEPLLNLGAVPKFVITVLGAAPQLLVGFALGIINEFTGSGNFQATITSTSSGSGEEEPSTEAADGSGTWISILDMKAASWSNGFDQEDELTIKNTAFPRSIRGWYSTGKKFGDPDNAQWALKGKCTKLEVWVGQDADSPGHVGPSQFTVTLDGKIAAEREANYLDEAQKIELDLTGVTRMTFQDERTNTTGAFNVWGSPRLLCSENPAPLEK